MPAADLISLVTPTMDVLFVRRDKGQDEINGLVIPGSSQLGKAQTGVVEKAGPEAAYYSGKRIIFGMFAGMQVKFQGAEDADVIILRPSDVVGVIQSKEEKGEEKEEGANHVTR